MSIASISKCLGAGLAAVLTLAAGARSAHAVGGFAFVNQTGTYTADPDYSYNSSGQAINVLNWAVGRYTVTFAGLSINGGNAQVTAFGNGPDYCNVASWSSNAVNVACFANYTGQYADSSFFVTLTDWNQASNPAAPAAAAYIWNSDPIHGGLTAPWYWSSHGSPITIRTTGYPGEYLVTFLSLAPDGAAYGVPIVTAYDGDYGNYCVAHVSSIVGSGPYDVGVLVNCYDWSGAGAPSRFSLAWSRDRVFESVSQAYLNKLGPDHAAFQASPNYDWKVWNTFTPGLQITWEGQTAGSGGNYVIRIPMKAAFAATFLVSSTGLASRCKVTLWGGYHSNLLTPVDGSEVYVSCFNYRGEVYRNDFNLIQGSSRRDF
jgi:hypothetical protein